MKKLAIKVDSKLFNINEIDNIEKILDDKISPSFTDFLITYSDCRVNENQYILNGTVYILNDILSFNEIICLTREFISEYNLKFLVFGMDPGGWHFCQSFEKQTFGKIIINRWTDYLPEEQFFIIADSFEDFINGLKIED